MVRWVVVMCQERALREEAARRKDELEEKGAEPAVSGDCKAARQLHFHSCATCSDDVS